MDFIHHSVKSKYMYNFSWMGRPIIQYPQDMVAMQELIWEVKPDLIIETGIAHGGSIIYYASLLELIGNGEIIGIDIDIREHNRKEIEAHSMFKRIKLIQGSSIAPEIVNQVKEMAKGKKSVMLLLDSNHTHEHVLGELNAFADLVTPGNYCVVFDTIVEDLDKTFDWLGRWGVGDNPKTAVHAFLKENKNFVIDPAYFNKTLISVCPDGCLKRIK
jgi:cephalosporin hydroxylase